MMVVIILLAAAAAAGGAFLLARRRALTAGRSETEGTLKARAQLDAHRLGYRYSDDRIFINGTGVYTGVVMATTTDEYATRRELTDQSLGPVSIAAALLGLFEGQPVECHELVRYRPVTTDGWIPQLLANCWNPTPMFRVLAERLAQHTSGTTPQRMWTLIVRLGDLPVRGADDPYRSVANTILGVAEETLRRRDLQQWWDRADQLHDTLARFGAEPLTRRDLLWLVRKAGAGHLPVADEPITHRRPWRGGWFALAAQLRGTDLGGGYLQLTRRDPETGESHHSYTATLVVADAPPRQVLNPANPWGKRVARLRIPPEISWRYTLVSPGDWKSVTTKAVLNINDEAEDRAKARAPKDARFTARLAQAATINATADDPQPGMVGRLRLIISAPTTKALARAIREVKEQMGEIQVEVPPYGAVSLLIEQLPGEAASSIGSLSAGAGGGLGLWARHTDTYAPALAVLGSHPQVGDRVSVERGREIGWIGYFIGYVKLIGGVVNFDPHAQIARGEGAGVGIFGKSGGGKTSLALLLFFWMSESGVLVSVLDPKIDFAGFIYYLAFGPQVLDPQFMAEADAGTLGTPGSRFQPVNQQLWDETAIHDLARGPRGSQDPWRITETFEAGYSLAETLIDVLFATDAHRAIARRALRALYRDHQAAAAAGRPFRCGLADLTGYIEHDLTQLRSDMDTARDRGGDISRARELIDLQEEVLARFVTGEHTPFLRQLLGRADDPEPPAERTRRRTIYTLAGFKAPDHPDNPELWTQEDRNASAVMLAVMTRMRRDNLHGRMETSPHTGEVKVRPTASFLDEGYMVTAIPIGRSYCLVNLRQGRSLGSPLIYLDQASRGIQAIERESRAAGNAEVNQFGTIFVFRQNSLGEAETSLKLLRSAGDDHDADREITNLSRKLLAEDSGGELRTGYCVMRDADNRVATVVVDQVFGPLQRAAQTNPSLKGIDWAIPVPADPAQWDLNPTALLQARRGVHDTAATTAYQADDSDLPVHQDDLAPPASLPAGDTGPAAPPTGTKVLTT